MFWVMQRDLYGEVGYRSLCNTLERFAIPHAFIKVVPTTSKLLPGDFDTFAWKDKDIMLAPDAVIDESGHVMVCGATTMIKAAKARGWTPGAFSNEDFRYESWLEHYGDNLLNPDSVVSRYADMKPSWEAFFIRPCEDTKSFSGRVMTKAEFAEWQHNVVVLGEQACFATVTPDTMVMASSLKDIFREYRFFVVDGVIVTGSQYKLGDRVIHDTNIDPDIWAYAQKMVDTWSPDRAFCLDIALTDLGPKVIEINCINSAGFYACDVAKWVMAIEDMKF